MSGDSLPVVASKKFDGKIRVAARVIDFLSSGLYQSPGSCLKELINNSYDADATLVTVSVKPDADFVAIEDDGGGMTREQFVRHFANVAESHKRDDGERTLKQREKIGKIGIGFIAANELCDEMEIYSTCEGSSDLLHVTIDFGEIRSRSFGERRSANGTVEKGDYHGEILTADPAEHYTRIYLKRLRESARESLVSPSPALQDMPTHTLYGKKPESARNEIASLKTFSDLDQYSQTRSAVALNVPVPYSKDWAPLEYKDLLEEFSQRAKNLDFTVVYDGVRLEKPIVLTGNGRETLLRTLEYEGKHIRVRGYLFARHGAYRPVELNGILIRIREAAVGEYDRSLLGYPNAVYQLFQNWVSGELYVDGLDEALNIDRRTLREVEPSYVELRSWFKDELTTFLKEVRDKLYSTRSQERNSDRARTQIKNVKALSERVRKEVGQVAADAITETLTPRQGRTPASRQTPELPIAGVEAAAAVATPESITDLLRNPQALKRLNRRYSLIEMLEIAVEVAQDVLPDEHSAKFIAEFARRLRG
ncbi:ATP-binding protein [Micromonospora taraxaci]|uniref:ATP-binding protein n=1 Tax=Micromonospora taraxaci TaxID=1316803 RepID=UPI0033F89C71